MISTSLLNQKFVTKLAVGRTPSSAPDPRSGLFHHTRNEGRQGRRLRTGGPPHIPDCSMNF
jgi:hypothetical protein